ncbi:hypothetical protein D3C74_491520 [compost metagenome]
MGQSGLIRLGDFIGIRQIECRQSRKGFKIPLIDLLVIQFLVLSHISDFLSLFIAEGVGEAVCKLPLVIIRIIYS